MDVLNTVYLSLRFIMLINLENIKQSEQMLLYIGI